MTNLTSFGPQCATVTKGLIGEWAGGMGHSVTKWAILMGRGEATCADVLMCAKLAMVLQRYHISNPKNIRVIISEL